MEAIERHDHSNHSEAISAEDVVVALDIVDNDIVYNVHMYHQAIQDETMGIVHEDQKLIQLVDGDGNFWNEQFDGVDGKTDEALQNIVKYLHQFAAFKSFKFRTNVPGGKDTSAIGKPDLSAQGERHLLQKIAETTRPGF